MAKIGQDFTLNAGDDELLSFSLTDDNGDPLDLTNYDIKWNAALTPKSTVLINKQTGGFGITVTDATAGTFTVALAGSDTAGLARGRYYHETQVIDPSSNHVTVAMGFLVILSRLIA